MDWVQFSIFFIGNIVFTLTLWLWNRSESRTDIRAITTRTDALIEAIHNEMKDFHEKYLEETKNFHARLCVIEERNRK